MAHDPHDPNAPLTGTALESERPLLIVDDSPVVRRMLAHFALKSGHWPVEAASLAELQTMSERAAAAAVAWVDYQLESESGDEVAAWLRGQNPDLAVVLMSATDDGTLLDHARTSDAALFVPKPIPYQLFAVVQQNAEEHYRQQRRTRLLGVYDRAIDATVNSYFERVGAGELVRFAALHEEIEACAEIFGGDAALIETAHGRATTLLRTLNRFHELMGRHHRMLANYEQSWGDYARAEAAAA